jgi:hypothetical protein
MSGRTEKVKNTMPPVYLEYPVKWVPISQVELNDDSLAFSAGIKVGYPGWWAPKGHPNRKYLKQTGSVLRSTKGEDYTRADHLRSRVFYSNLRQSILDHGLQTPLVTVSWSNPEDLAWTLPLKWPVWTEHWEKQKRGRFYRTIQGNTRLFILRDLGWTFLPVIDIGEEARRVLATGQCPVRAWVDNPDQGGRSKFGGEAVGFDWFRAHQESLSEKTNG